MAEPRLHPSFPALLQQFFVEYLADQRAVSRHTVASYRDTFQLFLLFAKKATGKMPTNLALQDISPELILSFLNHLEQERGNSVRSRSSWPSLRRNALCASTPCESATRAAPSP